MEEQQGLGKDFWDYRYQNDLTGWDMGMTSPPLKAYIDQIEDKKKNILIPGAGKSYEAAYLSEKGFASVALIDISPTLIAQLQEKFKKQPEIHLIEGDFFEHQGQYDLILEQTFFCALHPNQRPEYAQKMYNLLKENEKLVGVLFDVEFENGPPFGGFKEEYKKIFEPHFKINKMERCYNSHPARAGNELWIELQKVG